MSWANHNFGTSSIGLVQTFWEESGFDYDAWRDSQPVSWAALDMSAGLGNRTVLDDSVAFAKGGGGKPDGGGGNGGKDKGGGGNDGGGGGGGDPALPTTYVSTGPTGDTTQDFNVKVNYIGTWTAEQQAIVEWAAYYLSSIITSDIRDDLDLNGNLVDDVEINIAISSIDRGGKGLQGNILAETSVDVVRDAGTDDQWLPLQSTITLDAYDLDNALSQGLSNIWDSVILHEMMHAIGFFGYIFDQLNLTSDTGDYIGANATELYGATSIDLTDDGGLIASGSHWGETTFAPGGQPMTNELMTSNFGDYNEQTYLSDVTIATLQDLGYGITDPSPTSSYLVVDSDLLLV
jgi:hypothetical protein